jgi:PEP-CTERM motif
MRTLRFTLLPLALAASSGLAQAQVITVGTNINVTKLGGSQSETAVAINRINPNLIALSSNAQGTMINKFSTNAGSTWSNSALQVAGGYDSWMGADSFGNIFLSYQVAQVTSVARSTDGGATYAVTAIPGGGADHPEMSIGPGVAPGTNSIFLRDTTGAGNRVISATSSGLGVSTAYTVQTGLGSGNFGSTAVGPQGQTIFTSMNPSGGIGPTSMTLRYDADGTGPGGYVVQNTLTTNVGGFRPIPAQPSRTIDAQIELEYDFSGGANNGTLYALYTQAADKFTNNTDIVFRRSTDNGLTFSNELKLNNDVGTNSQFFGRLAVDQATGWLASVWFDARNAGAANNKVELWGTVSFNGGVTWQPNFKISGGMTNCINSGSINDANECGDYISMDFYNGTLVTAWADSSNFTGDNPNGTSELDIYFAKVTVAIPEPSTYALMALGLAGMLLRVRRQKVPQGS